MTLPVGGNLLTSHAAHEPGPGATPLQPFCFLEEHGAQSCYNSGTEPITGKTSQVMPGNCLQELEVSC